MSNYRHGWARTKLYGVWCSMRSRCENPNDPAYDRYGGRGIVVCHEWKDFKNFLADMGEPPAGMTLERRDNEKGYSPNNCIWADRKAQNRNKRGLRMVRVGGEEKCLGEWAEETGIAIGTIWQRLNKGWSPEEAVRTPLVRQRKGIKRGEQLRKYAQAGDRA